MRKRLFLSASLLIAVPFYAEKHLVITTFNGSPSSTSVNGTGYILVQNDSLSLTGIDGTLLFNEPLSNVRSLAIQDVTPTSIKPDGYSDIAIETDSISLHSVVKYMDEDGQVYIYIDNQKFNVNGTVVR